MRSRRSYVAYAALAAAAALVASACSSSGGQATAATKGTLVVGIFDPLSGPDADYGLEMVPGCDAAVSLINRAGGVLGHKLKCETFDTRGDPADAVPAEHQMVATTANLVGVIGPSSDEADATAPLLNAAHIPMFSVTGEPKYDHTTLQYFWRNTPADDATGYALAAVGAAKGYRRGAAIFTNDISAQANVPGLLAAFPHQGRKLVINLSMALDDSSYETEVLRTIAAHPDVIFNEADPQTAATFFGEYKQLNHGVLPPVLGTNVDMQPPWFKAVSGTVGAGAMTGISGVTTYAPSSGPAYATYKAAMLALGTSEAKQNITNPYVASYYDDVNVMALAMLAARSVNPTVFNAYIPKVTASGGASAVVSSFAEGAAKLPRTPVNYVGAIGAEDFNQWHNSSGGFEVTQWLPSGQLKVTGKITAAQVNALESGG